MNELLNIDTELREQKKSGLSLLLTKEENISFTRLPMTAK